MPIPNFHLHRHFGWKYKDLVKHIPQPIEQERLQDNPLIHKEILIQDGVQVSRIGQILEFTSKLGSQRVNLNKLDRHGLGGIKLENNYIKICSRDQEYADELHDYLFNVIRGVGQGYLAFIKLNGLGYKVWKSEKPDKLNPYRTITYLHMWMGKAHDDLYEYQNVKIYIIDPNLFAIFGINKSDVEQTVVDIKRYRKNMYNRELVELVSQKDIAERFSAIV